MNAADAFTAATAKIVQNTGCTVDEAIEFFMNRMITERPEMAGKVLAAFAAKMAA